MIPLSLKICIVDQNVSKLTKTMHFDPYTPVFEACRQIREKIPESNLGESKDYGLFLSDGETKKGVWLEPARNLEYYVLQNGDMLEYRRKTRTLKVRLLDNTLKTLQVDDSQPVANLMVVICTKLGITNYDEYSLVRENPDDNDYNYNQNYGTLTLKRKKDDKFRDIKMEQLKKKLNTDDQVNWIDFSKTLREQGIDEDEPVLLRRKFFFSDGNIDASDPIQLNLLYIQTRDAILNGTHPVTQELACRLAGIQSQIQFGDYDPSKHAFLDIKEFLPASYVKVRGIEKKIFLQHKACNGLSELDAMVLYTKTCRGLPTYGVTFFLVKEKMNNKNKLVPTLLGISKDSILRLDENTKEILKTWPLTTVLRWGASSNVFTLDFGDYSDQYYSVQTTEAEQIHQLIAGYIDIILKKKRAKDHFGIEGDEGSTLVEDIVSPLRATVIQNEALPERKVFPKLDAQPEVNVDDDDGARPYTVGHVGTAKQTTVSGQIAVAHAPTTVQKGQITTMLTGPQTALLSTIHAGYEVITTVETELISKVIIPDLNDDEMSTQWRESTIDISKQDVSSQLANMNAATAQVVTMMSGETDYYGVESAITSITENLPEMSKSVRMLAALTPAGDELLDAARRLCSAFTDLLKSVQPHSNQSHQDLLNAAARVGEASHYILTEIGEIHFSKVQEMLLNLARAVAKSTAALVLKTKAVALTLPSEQQQNDLVSSATKCALATSQLVACTKVMAPTLDNPVCQQQLISAVQEVARAVEDLVDMCNSTSSNKNLNRDLTKAASEVTQTLNQLLTLIKEQHVINDVKSAVETMMSSSNRLLAASGNTSEMVHQAKILGQATTQLIQGTKGEVENELDSDLQKKVLTAAKKLADATAKMVEAARNCASHPKDITKQEALVQTVEELRRAATPTLRYKLHKSEIDFIPDREEIKSPKLVRKAQQQINSRRSPVKDHLKFISATA